MDLGCKCKVALDFWTFPIANIHAHSCAFGFILRELGEGVVRFEVLQLLEVILFLWGGWHDCWEVKRSTAGTGYLSKIPDSDAVW